MIPNETQTIEIGKEFLLEQGLVALTPAEVAHPSPIPHLPPARSIISEPACARGSSPFVAAAQALP